MPAPEKMNDIELTRKLEFLKWEVDLNAGTVKSDLIHSSRKVISSYIIIP
jgi:hypothetical protein